MQREERPIGQVPVRRQVRLAVVAVLDRVHIPLAIEPAERLHPARPVRRHHEDQQLERDQARQDGEAGSAPGRRIGPARGHASRLIREPRSRAYRRPNRRSISARLSLSTVGRPWLQVAARGVASICRSSASISAGCSRRPARMLPWQARRASTASSRCCERDGLAAVGQLVGEVAQQRRRVGGAEAGGQRARPAPRRRRSPRSPARGRAAPAHAASKRAAVGRAAGRPRPAAASGCVRTPPAACCARSASWVSRSWAACWSTSTRLPSAATARM